MIKYNLIFLGGLEFGHWWRRPIEAPVRKTDWLRDSSLVRYKGKSGKTISQIIAKDLELNGPSVDMINDRILWRHLIHMANPIWWEKTLIVVVFLDRVRSTSYNDIGY
jgi:hypothetical protein